MVLLLIILTLDISWDKSLLWYLSLVLEDNRVEQNNSCMFEFPTFLLPTKLGQKMHSSSALTENVSLN